MTPKAYIYEGQCYGLMSSEDEGTVVVVYASSRNQARQYVSVMCDLDYVNTTARRCEVMDGLPITDSIMLKLGLFGWLECFGCRRQIHGEGPDSTDVQEWPNAKDGSPYAYLYPDDDEDDDFPAIKGEEPPAGDVISRPVHAEGVGMFCSEACYAKWHGSKEWHAMRKRRGLEQAS